MSIRTANPTAERWLFLYAPLIFFMLFLVGPFYWMLITALKPDAELYDGAKSPLYVATPSLDHFRYLFEKTEFVTWTMNTMMVATLSTAIALLMGVPAGYALARLKFRGANFVGTMIFVTYLVPTSLLFIPMVEVMGNIGLDDSIWSLVVVYPTFLVPLVDWLMSG
jgi:multiple sugar transport system permease protein